MKRLLTKFINVSAQQWTLLAWGMMALVVLGTWLGGELDFLVYCRAAGGWLSQGWSAVYDPSALTPFKYHPLTVFFFLPFVGLPLPLLKFVWALVQGGVLWALHRCLGARGVSAKHFVLALVFVVHALTWQIKLANITFVLLGLLVCAALSTRRFVSSLCIAGLILFKPTWLVLAVPLFLACLASSSRKESIQMSLTTGGLLLGGSVLIFLVFSEQPYLEWWRTLADPLHAHNYPKNDNQSWYGLCFRWRDWVEPYLSWLAGSLVFTAVFVWVSWPYRSHLRALLLASPLLWLWISPLSWIHHQLLLLPFFALVLLSRERNYLHSGATQGSRGFATPWTSGGLLVSWLAFNGTGELFLGRQGFIWAHQAGIPLMGLVSALFLLPTFYREFVRQVSGPQM